MHRLNISSSAHLLLSQASRRYASNESKDGFRRFMQTIRSDTSPSPLALPWTASTFSGRQMQPDLESLSRWAPHKLAIPQEPVKQPVRRSRALKFKRPRPESVSDFPKEGAAATDSPAGQEQSIASVLLIISIDDSLVAPESVPASQDGNGVAQASAAPVAASSITLPAPKKRRQLRPRKALITLSKSAIAHLQQLLSLPEPKFIRIGVRNRGCSGLTYHLEYVTEAGKFDERIDQDGVTVLIDSKALFSIVGSEMDWLDDKLSSRFVFKNPNSKGTCGCGESFMV